MEEKTDLSVSDSDGDQEASQSSIIQIATSKMKLSVEEIEISLRLFNKRNEKLRSKVNNQKSLKDVYRNMASFDSYYNDMQAYIESQKENFKRQLGIILGENCDQQLLCIENNPSASSERDRNHDGNNRQSYSSKGLHNFSTPCQVRSICGVDEKAQSKEDTLGPSVSSSKDHQSTVPNDMDAKESLEGEVNSDQPASKGNIIVSNSLESYDSSNDLPEAKTVTASPKERTSDGILPSSQGGFVNDSDPTTSHYPGSSQQNDDTDHQDERSCPDTGPRIVSVSTMEENRTRTVDSTPELKTTSQQESQMSESLLLNSSPTLLVMSSKDQDKNEGAEKLHLEGQNCTELDPNLLGAPSVDADDHFNGEEPILTPVSLKRRNEMDATSRKVNEWLNRSLNSENIRNSSSDEENQILNKIDDSDSQTKANGADLSTKNSSNGDNASIKDNDSSTYAGAPSKSTGSHSKDIRKKLFKANDVIEIFSDDEIFASVSSKKTSSPNAKHLQKKNIIEVVDMEETVENSEDEICVVNSSEESDGSAKTEDPTKSNHHISESSDPDSKTETPKVGILEQNSNLNTSTSREKSITNIATQGIYPEKVDEAKRTLLESSCSSNENVASVRSRSDDWDSEATVIVDKKKKFKKKKKKKKQASNDSVSFSEASSSDEEEKIKKLLDLKSLRKRKRVFGSSNSSTEKSAESSEKSYVSKRRKKKRLSDEEESYDVYDENVEPEVDESNLPTDLNTAEDNRKDIYREMLLASDSSQSSDEQCPPTPEHKNVSKNDKINLEDSTEKRKCFSEDSGKKKKKRKYDPLLHGKFSLSSSDSDGKPKKQQFQDSKIYDLKYEKLLEKKKKKEESKKNQRSSSEDDSDSGASSLKQNEEPINFVSVDPECVELSEDDSEDDRTTIGYHQISSSASEDDDVQCIPQSQETTESSKGRKNIRKVISVEEMTAESKQAAKEEEERQKRLSDKEKWFSQSFSLPEPEKLVLDADEETKQPLVTVHPGLTQVLKKHQIEGVQFMWNSCFESVKLVNSSVGSGCVVAHCMGLGKSLQVVTLVHTIINHPELNLRTVLIVCPKSVVLNWGDEFKKWLRQVENTDQKNRKVEVNNLNVFRDVHMKERGLRDWQSKGGVMILGYAEFRALVKHKDPGESLQSVFNSIRKHLVDPGPDVVVFDEGHMLKNSTADTTKAASLIRTKRRIVLTGTPMQNNLMEYYHMVNLIKPNYLGDKKEFRNRFFNPITNGQFQDSTPQDVKIMKHRTHVLHRKLHKIVQRYDANFFKDELPPRYEYVLKLRISEVQAKLYKHFISSLKKDTEGTQADEKNRLLLKSDKVLSLICNHPKLASDTFDSPAKPEEQLNIRGDWQDCLKGLNLDDVTISPKTNLFFKVLKKCADNRDKLLVFSQHLKTLDLLEFFLKKASCNNGTTQSASAGRETWISGVDYFRLDGSTPGTDRQKYCHIFNSNNPRARLFLLSTKAGALGLNLTGANRAIVFDVSWNPSVDAQSVYRIYRFGQNKPCFIYRFVMKGTMEEKKYHRQVSKLGMSSRVVDKHQVGRHFQEKYLRALFEYNFDYGQRFTPKLSQDKVLTELLINSDLIDTYEEHDNLLMNLQDEELTAEERAKAMEEYEAESNPPIPPPVPGPSGVSAGQQNPLPSVRPSGSKGSVGPQDWTEAKKQWIQKEEDFFKQCYKEKVIPLPYIPIAPPVEQVPETTPNLFSKFTVNTEKLSEAKSNVTCINNFSYSNQCQPVLNPSTPSANEPNVNHKPPANPLSAPEIAQTYINGSQHKILTNNSVLPNSFSNHGPIKKNQMNQPTSASKAPGNTPEPPAGSNSFKGSTTSNTDNGMEETTNKVYLPPAFHNIIKDIHAANQVKSNTAQRGNANTVPNLAQSKINGKSNANGNQQATTSSSSAKHRLNSSGAHQLANQINSLTKPRIITNSNLNLSKQSTKSLVNHFEAVVKSTSSIQPSVSSSTGLKPSTSNQQFKTSSEGKPIILIKQPSSSTGLKPTTSNQQFKTSSEGKPIHLIKQPSSSTGLKPTTSNQQFKTSSEGKPIHLIKRPSSSPGLKPPTSNQQFKTSSEGKPIHLIKHPSAFSPREFKHGEFSSQVKVNQNSQGKSVKPNSSHPPTTYLKTFEDTSPAVRHESAYNGQQNRAAVTNNRVPDPGTSAGGTVSESNGLKDIIDGIKDYIQKNPR